MVGVVGAATSGDVLGVVVVNVVNVADDAVDVPSGVWAVAEVSEAGTKKAASWEEGATGMGAGAGAGAGACTLAMATVAGVLLDVGAGPAACAVAGAVGKGFGGAGGYDGYG